MLDAVTELEARALAGDEDAIRRQLHLIVPEYREPNHEAPLPPPAGPGVIGLPDAGPSPRTPNAAQSRRA